MSDFLSTKHFPTDSTVEKDDLETALNEILDHDYQSSFFVLLKKYQIILADNERKKEWPDIDKKLMTLFKCGKSEVVNGPMIGIPLSIRDSDPLKDITKQAEGNRSAIAKLELLATTWNVTFADTGLWMGKAFEPVSLEMIKEKTANNSDAINSYDSESTRIGRNFFRTHYDPNLLQKISLPTLTNLWGLKNRPVTTKDEGFYCELLNENIKKEKAIPYSKTGGYFICNFGTSVIPDLKNKATYQLNYRWPKLGPDFPMTRLVDELVRIDDGIYLGQLIYATKHYSLGNLTLPNGQVFTFGDTYPRHSIIDKIKELITNKKTKNYYGYQHNGFFLMVDTAYAKEFYADDAFFQLRPRKGESGYKELGYEQE